jgi:hypothetical protein
MFLANVFFFIRFLLKTIIGSSALIASDQAPYDGRFEHFKPPYCNTRRRNVRSAGADA